MKSDKQIIDEIIRINDVRKILETNGIANAYLRGVLNGLLFNYFTEYHPIESDFDSIIEHLLK